MKAIRSLLLLILYTACLIHGVEIAKADPGKNAKGTQARKTHGDSQATDIGVKVIRSKLNRLGYDAGKESDRSQTTRKLESGSRRKIATKDLKLEQAILKFEKNHNVSILSPLLTSGKSKSASPIATIINNNTAKTSALTHAIESELHRKAAVVATSVGTNTVVDDPKKEDVTHLTVTWMNDVQQAYARSVRENKVLLIMYLSDACEMCDNFEKHESQSSGMAKLSDCLIMVKANPKDTAAQKIAKKFKVKEFPTSLLILPNPTKVHSIGTTEGYGPNVSYPHLLRTHIRKAALEGQPYVPKRFIGADANYCE